MRHWKLSCNRQAMRLLAPHSINAPKLGLGVSHGSYPRPWIARSSSCRRIGDHAGDRCPTGADALLGSHLGHNHRPALSSWTLDAGRCVVAVSATAAYLSRIQWCMRFGGTNTGGIEPGNANALTRDLELSALGAPSWGSPAPISSALTNPHADRFTVDAPGRRLSTPDQAHTTPVRSYGPSACRVRRKEDYVVLYFQRHLRLCRTAENGCLLVRCP